MDSWFYFLLHNNSSELDALKELSSCNLQHSSTLEDLETGERTICATATPSLFPVKWKHISSYKKLENTEINWTQEWDSFSPYFQNGLAKIPLSDFLLGSKEELTLLPGPGFGDLSHPTTTLSLELLAKHASNQNLIDLGCGSGILGLAALKWGARFVYGLDIDPAALEHTKENAILNLLINQIALSSTLPTPLTHKPDLLVMNMTFEDQKQALKTLSFYPDLWITSGILEEQKQIYLSWGKELGLKLQNCHSKNGWIACLFEKIIK